MKRYWRPCIALLCGACAASSTHATYQGGDFHETITIGTWDREFRIHVPERATLGPVAPLILAFSGSGQTAEQLESETGLDAAADAAGVIVVYPEPVLGAWDPNDDFVPVLGINDMLFIRTMLDRLKSEYVVDADRIIAVGLSNGAVFSQRLGCELAEQVAGFVAVAGTLPRPMRDACHPERPVDALYIIGSNDPYFPVGGGGSVLSVDSTMRFWSDRSHCSGRGDRIALPDSARDGTQVFRTRFVNCADDRTIVLDSIAGSGHGWPGEAHPHAGISRNLSANEEIIRFVFAGRSRPR